MNYKNNSKKSRIKQQKILQVFCMKQKYLSNLGIGWIRRIFNPLLFAFLHFDLGSEVEEIH
jgi:hypothetical protein